MYSKLKRLISIIWNNRFLRYIIIGGINTLFGYSVYSILILLNIDYKIASLLAHIIGVIFNYFSIGFIVFNNKNIFYIFKFIIYYVIYYFLNLGALTVLIKIFSIHPIISQGICLPFMVTLSFFVNKYIIFKNK